MAQLFNKLFVKKVVKDLERISIAKLDFVSLTAHGLLVDATPVRLGQARAGWNFQLNSRDESFPPKPPNGQILAKPPAPNANAKKVGDFYHISNFVEHIVYLNEFGLAEKTQGIPAHFIETAIFKAVQHAEKNT